MSKEKKNNKVSKGCRGCRYLDSDPRVFPPWECWYPRKSKTSPVRVDLERFRVGCKGRTVEEVDTCRTGEKKGLNK